jgi:copper(I)-binding protein
MPAKPLLLLLTLPLFLALATGCDKKPERTSPASATEATLPQVSNARVLLPPPGAPMAAAYFDVLNPGATAIELRAVTSPFFSSIEMHETREEDGMSRMRQIEQVAIPAGSSASFEPGGKHLMLMGARLDADKPVQEIPMRLEFIAADGSKRVVEAGFAVQTATDGAAQSHH